MSWPPHASRAPAYRPYMGGKGKARVSHMRHQGYSHLNHHHLILSLDSMVTKPLAAPLRRGLASRVRSTSPFGMGSRLDFTGDNVRWLLVRPRGGGRRCSRRWRDVIPREQAHVRPSAHHPPQKPKAPFTETPASERGKAPPTPTISPAAAAAAAAVENMEMETSTDTRKHKCRY